MRRYDAVALGELLIDFTACGESKSGIPRYEANPGGAPCNVMAQMSRLGRKTAFIGKVGDDDFGHRLRRVLRRIGISTEGLVLTHKAPTTLAFVHLGEGGERSFSFVRNGSADTLLAPGDIDASMIENCKIFHCGSISMTDEPSLSATRRALDIAVRAGTIVSVDPNLREPLWPNLERAREAIWELVKFADIVKISDCELEFLYGSNDVADCAARLIESTRAALVFATCGSGGALLRTAGACYRHEAFTEVDAIDTTGAGDSFLGAALSRLLAIDKLKLTDDEAMDVLRYANAAAATVITRHGAILSMPEEAEIEALIRNHMEAKK